MWNIAFSIAIASWAVDDAEKNGQGLCYDYDTFVYFAWPVILPVYLFRTRGLKAFVTLLGFAALSFGVAFGWAIVTFVRNMS